MKQENLLGNTEVQDDAANTKVDVGITKDKIDGSKTDGEDDRDEANVWKVMRRPYTTTTEELNDQMATRVHFKS